MITFSNFTDTIAAISTPPGVGGISVIRISGPEALTVTLSCLSLDSLSPRYAQFASVIDPANGEKIDDVIAVFFRAPASYTGEDVVEISCHGGYAAAPSVLGLLFKYGVRPALPGEFTRRAFVNGKMDLLQAEAVADLIHAVSESGQRLAARTLSGSLSEKVYHIRDELKDIAAVLELELDFSEEEISPLSRNEIYQKIDRAYDHISALAETYTAGKILREGALVPIVGRPNAGKSSLLNALLKEDRAIISHIPGTTRDTIEESFVHDKILFRLVDTAGLRDTEDPIEKMGTERTMRALNSADMILLIIDPTMADDYAPEKHIIEKYDNTPLILVYNKSDLSENTPFRSTKTTVRISATHRLNLDELQTRMCEILQQHYHVDGNTIAITKQRHRHALLQSMSSLERARVALDTGLTHEFTAVDIREAVRALDDITGQTTSEDVLNHIFDHFCIGK
ncbi:MAG: tRNA uridine-5-carboxymethylaminomethyl(34) synthesis GTPase MnmE [FCB group bacterium]|nr:tRNA uridine-5-carboxymethylaminomethyl(34) synthesis GTPase MnmE [FCB group bacterium]